MGRIEDIDARLKSRMDAMNKRLADRMAALDARLGDGGTATTAAAKSEATPGPRPGLGTAGARIRSALQTAQLGAAVTSDPRQWETTKEELVQLMEYVKSSPHVASNELYSAVAPQLQFFSEPDPAINARATYTDEKPSIYINVGAILYANLISAAYVGSELAQSRFPQQFSPLSEIVDSLVRSMAEWGSQKRIGGFAISAEDACNFAEKYNLHLVMYDQVHSRKAKSLAAGIIVGVLAHEYGHLALGHLHGQSQTLEISRNDERQADLFASSVISSSPFGEYLVLGSILWELVWVCREKVFGDVATTHPLASERLANLLRDNPTIAANLGYAVPEGTSLLSDVDRASVAGIASSASVENARFDWTSGVSCAFGCLGECRGN